MINLSASSTPTIIFRTTPRCPEPSETTGHMRRPSMDYINRAMPMATPGTLSADEVYSLIAYLLYLNGIIEENTTLDAETLLSIEMPARHLFYWSDEAMELTAPGTAPDPE